jgi:hypothetical protein
MNALPLAFKYEEDNKGIVGNLMIPLTYRHHSSRGRRWVKKVIKHMNIVLSQIIPGMTISERISVHSVEKWKKSGLKFN